ncbi:triacylglycerol lipase [Nodularia harveyana UHCC-0300]|uniref:Triacylglycerol lipase n=1 Tax=Nodularia harveyana UHCC-0300 TaxID=2974287 RepID=A0ABU5UEW4_9CYAN|nr:triacylglycerol lipase [Nodularia harveyana]MEA5582089.1 triacylglycerol lipase [Nodularia harveyana UHCC-0300]
MNTENQQRNSVLLIHGIDDTGAVFNQMTSYLKQLGWSVYTLNLIPNNGAVSLDILAQQVANYVTNTFPPEQPIDLIGFSMGGIVSRYYVQRLGGINRVQRFITISAPHHGTVTAYASQRPGCLQMRRNSQFIKDLNADATILDQLNFTSIWTPYDLMIVPAKSSQMPLGKEVLLPVMLHSWMLTDSRCLATVASALTEPIKPRHQFRYTENYQKSPLGGGNI